MSKLAGEYYVDKYSSNIKVYQGFSWPFFFLGLIWFFYKKLIGKGFIYLVVSLVLAQFLPLFLIINFILAFFVNNMHSNFIAGLVTTKNNDINALDADNNVSIDNKSADAMQDSSNQKIPDDKKAKTDNKGFFEKNNYIGTSFNKQFIGIVLMVIMVITMLISYFQIKRLDNNDKINRMELLIAKGDIIRAKAELALYQSIAGKIVSENYIPFIIQLSEDPTKAYEMIKDSSISHSNYLFLTDKLLLLSYELYKKRLFNEAKDVTYQIFNKIESNPPINNLLYDKGYQNWFINTRNVYISELYKKVYPYTTPEVMYKNRNLNKYYEKLYEKKENQIREKLNSSYSLKSDVIDPFKKLVQFDPGKYYVMYKVFLEQFGNMDSIKTIIGENYLKTQIKNYRNKTYIQLFSIWFDPQIEFKMNEKDLTCISEITDYPGLFKLKDDCANKAMADKSLVGYIYKSNDTYYYFRPSVIQKID